MININNLGLHSSLFHKIQFFLQTKFFNAIYQVLQYENQAIYLTFSLSIIQLFQLVYLAFAVKTSYLWQNESLSKGINTFLGYFTILKHIMNTDFNLFLAVLYFCFSVVVLIILLLFLVGIFDKEAPRILVKFLSYVLKFIHTIGYFPIMQVFFGYLACHPVKNQSIMIYLSTQQCGTTEYQIHAIFAILGIILSEALMGFITLVYYESKRSAGASFSQKSGRPYSLFHYCTIANIMTYQLLDTEYMAVILIEFLISSYLIFHVIKNSSPFHNKNVQTLWVVIAALNFWTMLMLTFAAILEGLYFGKSIYAWLIGIPFIIIIIVREPSEQVDLFASNIKPHESGENIIKLCDFLLDMIEAAVGDLYIQLELDAYMEVHRDTCPRTDCVLKIRKQTEKKKSVRQGNLVLLDVINQIYYYGIKSFPSDIHLRLCYAYFLTDYLKAKQLSLIELQQAEQNNVSFDYAFIIYRYKRIIEEELQQQQQESSAHVDHSNEMTFMAQSKQLQEAIEKTALLFIDFWSQLQEDMPDIGKLQYIGFKIQMLSQIVEQQWKRIKRLSQKNKKLYSLMGKYYLQVWSDEVRSQALFEFEKQNKNSEFKYILEEMGSNPKALIVCFTEGDQLGLIQSVNKAACSLLGYTKTDLIGRHINILQPEIYSKHHQLIMSRFLDSAEEAHLNGEVKESVSRLIFAKTKSHYVIQCTLTVKVIQTPNSEIFLIGQLQQDVQFKPQCYLLCQSNGLIDNINSMCIKILGIDQKMLEMKRFNINDLFPYFLDQKEDFQTRAGDKLIYNPSQKLSKDLDFIRNSQEHIQIGTGEQIIFNCQVTEIYFSSLTTASIENRVFGYTVRLEQIKKRDQGLQIIKQLPKQPLCFKFTQYNIYQLERCSLGDTNENSIKFDSSIIWESVQKQTEESGGTLDLAIKTNEEQGLGYGIRTLRLLNDKIMDIEDQIIEEEDEDLNQNQIQQEELDEEQSILQLSHNYSSKQMIENEIRHSLIPPVILKFKLAINIILVILIVSVFVEYFVNQYLNQKLEDSLPYLSYNNQRVAIVLLLQSTIEDMKFLYYNFQPLQQQLTNNTFYNIQQRNLVINLHLATQLQMNLSLASVDLLPTYNIYSDTFKSLNVPMRDVYGGVNNFTFSEAVEQLLSVAIQLNNSNFSVYYANNPNVYYFEYNSYNSIGIMQHVSQNYYYYNILSCSNRSQTSISAFLIVVSSFTIVLQLVILFRFLSLTCYFYQVYVNILEVLHLFLDIKDNDLKQIYLKCEIFLTELQIGDDDDVISEIEEKPTDKNEEQWLSLRVKKRKHKDSSDKLQYQLQSSLILNLIVFFYFFFLYFQVDTIVNQVNELIPIINATSFAECYSRFADNALRQFFFDPNFPIYGQDAYTEINKLILELYDIDAQIHQLHSESWDLLEIEYQQAFFNIFINNPCEIISQTDSTVTVDACESFYGGVMTNGLSIGMTKFMEDLRQTMEDYKERNLSEIQKYKLSNDTELNFRMNLINTASMAQMRRIQKIFIRASYRYLLDIMNSSVLLHFDQIYLAKLVVFIIMDVVLFMGIVFVWIPMELKCNQDILNSRLLLLMIPLNEMLRIKSIKNYLRNKIYH